MRDGRRQEHVPSLRGELDPLPSFNGAGSSSLRNEASLLDWPVAGWLTCFVLPDCQNKVV
jgi:hypothetical protein